MPGNEFIITNIGCILVDTISQFREGAEAHDPKVFKSFTEDHFPNFDKELPKTIPDDLVVASIHEVDTVSEAFYSGFRCGLAHSGTVLAFGGHAVETDGNLYEIRFDPNHAPSYCYNKETGEKYPFIVINPMRLIEEIRSALATYLERLRDPDESEDLRWQFATKLEYDFGEYGKRLKESLD
jgi:hypothetical protein